MASIKRYFVTPYFMAQLIVVMHSVFNIYQFGIGSAWLGSLLASFPAALLFVLVMLKKLPRTSANLPFIIISGVIGSALAWALPSETQLPLIYASIIGLLGGLLYVFWYSRFGDRDVSMLVVGSALPEFTLYQSDGTAVSTNEIIETSALLMFFRGNWCPLCMAQINEISKQYRELDQRGIKIYLISPQSETNTKELANRFSVPMNFLIDRDLQVARKLHISIDDGVPMGVFGYEPDTVMPTVVMTDSKGKIILADLTDNYRVRPEPATFLKIFDQHASAN